MGLWVVFTRTGSECDGFGETFTNYEKALDYYNERKRDMEEQTGDLSTDGDETVVIAKVEKGFMPYTKMNDSKTGEYFKWEEFNFESESHTSSKEDLYEWILNNFTEVAMDMFSDVAEKFAEENGWDEVETHFMVEQMVEKTKVGMLNIVKTCDV